MSRHNILCDRVLPRLEDLVLQHEKIRLRHGWPSREDYCRDQIFMSQQSVAK